MKAYHGRRFVMSKPFWIIADVACDLPITYVEKCERLLIMPMPYQRDDQEFIYKTGDEADLHSFYENLENGAVYTTAQINIDTYYNTFKNIIEKGEGLICLPLSSGISGSINNAIMAKEKIKENYPDAEIAVCDSICASLGYGLLVHHLIKEREKGITLKEAEEFVNKTAPHLIHWFTVDNLKCLYRGGRISKSSAYFGSMLRIKPVLNVDKGGFLTPQENVQGRKRSIKTLAKRIEEVINPRAGQPIFIGHADCEEDALLLKSYLQKALPGIKDYLISPIGAIVGAHSGPGTLAVFCLGYER